MARSDAPELLPTYEAAAQIRERALRRLDSLFVQGSAVWSVDAVGELHARFVENPDTSADGFENKLRRQLEGASPGAIQLMAELLYVHLLMASDIKGSTKRRNISTVLSWSESPSEIPLDLDAALDHGFAHAGMGGPIARAGDRPQRPGRSRSIVARRLARTKRRTARRRQEVRPRRSRSTSATISTAQRTAHEDCQASAESPRNRTYCSRSRPSTYRSFRNRSIQTDPLPKQGTEFGSDLCVLPS